MIKIRTPLVIATIFAVVALGIARLIFVPEFWPSSLAALAFFPLAVGALVRRSRSVSDADKARKLSGKFRAGLVGAGVLLATSLLFSITDNLGYTGQSDDASERPLFVILAAIIAVAIDLLSARLEKKAEEDPD